MAMATAHAFEQKAGVLDAAQLADAQNAMTWSFNVEVFGLQNGEDVFPCPAVFHSAKGYEKEPVDGSFLNGKCGRATWIRDDTYAVDLIEGGSYYILEQNLRELDTPTTEESNVDVVWPALDSGDYMQLGLLVVNALHRKGFCVIRPSHADAGWKAMASKAADAAAWIKPFEPEFAEAWLGEGKSSVFSWLREEFVHNAYLESIQQLSCVLAPYSGDDLGFVLANSPPQNLMLRKNIENDQQRYYDEAEDPEEEQQIKEKLIQFIQHRRLCVMSFVNCEKGSTMQFTPWHDDTGLQTSTTSVEAGLMVIFRHDLLGYSYMPEGSDLVLQSWLMQALPTLEVNQIVGSETSVMSAVGATGHQIASSREVHIMAYSGYMAGSTFGLQQIRTLYTSSADGMIDIPTARWDLDPYYVDDPDKLGPGNCWTRHSGLVDIMDLTTFDPFMFGYDMNDAEAFPIRYRKSLEVFTDVLHQVGKSKESMKGERFYWTVGDWAQRAPGEYERAITHEISEKILVGPFLSYHFGTAGTAQSIDTACSAAMSAYNNLLQELKMVRDSRSNHRLETQMDHTQGCVGSPHYIEGHLGYIGMSMAHMLGWKGRSLTFDDSANGYNRGEGFTGFYLRRSSDSNQDIEDALEQLASAMGGASNQDGRSASLTAPNGPSQSYCVRLACRDANNRDPQDLHVTELHGTGTAIGDPIETGSTKAVMMNSRGVRQFPIAVTAGKSVTGHNEANAGTAGICRTIICIYGATALPNIHLKSLNRNCDANGFPALFQTEATDLGLESIAGGVNSFGFGGTNGRAELWGQCKSGSRRTASLALTPEGLAVCRLDKRPDLALNDSSSGVVIDANPNRISGSSGQAIDADKIESLLIECPQCLGQMCWLCKEATSDEKHRCTQVRKEGADYSICSNCYGGEYMGDAPVVASINPGHEVYMIASYYHNTPYRMKQRLDANGDSIYVAGFRVKPGHQVERFVLSIDNEVGQKGRFIYPIKFDAGKDTRAVGPRDKGFLSPNYWMIDNLKAGEAYEITFTWNDRQKRVSWRRLDQPPVGSVHELFVW